MTLNKFREITEGLFMVCIDTITGERCISSDNINFEKLGNKEIKSIRLQEYASMYGYITYITVRI